MLELHSNARFAWLRKTSGDDRALSGPTGIGRGLFWAHNLVYWFFLLPFLTPMSYGTGFAMYSAILFSRFLANTWINVRDLTWEEYDAYPFRIP